MRRWKVALQKLANELALPINVCHLPPETSTWNKIEHRLFAFLTQNWRGKPLVTHHVIVELIATTTTQAGLTVRCRLDERTYPKGKRISDQQLAEVNLVPATFQQGNQSYVGLRRSLAGVGLLHDVHCSIHTRDIDKAKGQPIALQEDGSIQQAVTAAPLAPGRRVVMDWPLRFIQTGTSQVVVSAVRRESTTLSARTLINS